MKLYFLFQHKISHYSRLVYYDMQYEPSLPGIIAIRCEKGEGTASTEIAVRDEIQ